MRSILIVFLAGCGLGASDAGTTNDANSTGTGDAADQCRVDISFDPAVPVAGPDVTVRAIAHLAGASSLPTYVWQVLDPSNNTPTITSAQTDNREIEFPIAKSGQYLVTADPGLPHCNSTSVPLNVAETGATNAFRLRVNTGTAPPQEKTLSLPVGVPSYAAGTFSLEAGIAITPTITRGSTRVPAYIRLAPTTAPDAIVEAFSGTDGTFTAKIVDAHQDILVIPAIAGVAPQLFAAYDFASTSPTFALDVGAAISGTVKDPSGAALAGAHVQLSANGIPSTLTTTASDGSFSVLQKFGTGQITVDVTPADASGLPRLTATAAFDPSAAFAVKYAAGLAPRDLAGAHVLRGGVPIANVKVTLVGPIDTVGTVVAGVSATASGAVHASATTDASGVLPTLRAAPRALAAVIEGSELAVASVDLTSSVPSTISAPASRTLTPTVLDSHAHALSGVALDVVPTGSLALAGIQPTRVYSDASGTATLVLAGGADYEIRAQDPQSRAAPVTAVVDDDTGLATIALHAATVVSGTIEIDGQAGGAPNALVQVLCKSCTGVARTRPLAEVTTDATGHYRYAIDSTPQ